MNGHLADRWYTTFRESLPHHPASKPLQEAARDGRLGDWTQALTGVVVDVCGQMGWQTAARWHPAHVLPVSRHEYLALDAVAFDCPAGGTPHWIFPVAVFELENSPDDDKVAYSLWKVLCVRAGLRIVFFYRQSLTVGSDLVQRLGKQVVGALPIEHRQALPGQTMLIVGSHDDQAGFPYGYFREWVLDKNTGRFNRI